MNALLRKILFKKQSSKPITLLMGVVGLYLCFLFWYLIKRIHLIENSGLTAPVFASLVCLPFIMILVIYKAIDCVFYNKRIRDILCMPVAAPLLFKLYAEEVTKLPAAIITMLFAVSCTISSSYFSILELFIISLTFLYTFCFFIFILLTFVLKVSPAHCIGYIFTFVQYSGFIITLLLCKDFIPFLILYKKTGILLIIYKILTYPLFLPIELGLCTIGLWISYHLFSKIFIRQIHKINEFQFSKKSSSKEDLFPIRFPYLYLEKKRYLQNKELIFYSLLRSVLAIIIIIKIISNRFDFSEVITEMIVILLLSTLGIYAATSYSSDLSGKTFSSFFPVNPQKIFMSKIFSSFLLNELLIIFYILALFIQDPSAEIYLLFVYGSITNYCCSFVGVFLDFLMPYTTENKSELLHGNINKLLTVLLATAKLLTECYISFKFFAFHDPLLVSLLLDFILLFLLNTIMFLFWRKNYDRN